MRLARDRRGIAALEFAMVAPVLALLTFAAFDMVQFLRTQLRLESAAMQIGQIVSQCTQVTSPGDTEQFWAEAQRLVGSAADLTSPTGGAILVTAVYNKQGANMVAWQIRAGNGAYASAMNGAGGTASILGSFVVPSGETLFVTEVFTAVQPWILSAGWMGANDPRVLSGTKVLLSRSPDPARLQQPPSTSNSMACTG